jgi:protoporphyrinogen IX oxidase
MASLFVLPRALLHWKLAFNDGKNCDAITSLSIALFRFGGMMAILAISFGLWLWLGYGFSGRWLTLKLIFVSLLVVHYLISGWLLFTARKRHKFKSRLFLRVFNESPVLLVLPIIYLVLTKDA